LFGICKGQNLLTPLTYWVSQLVGAKGELAATIFYCKIFSRFKLHFPYPVQIRWKPNQLLKLRTVPLVDLSDNSLRIKSNGMRWKPMVVHGDHKSLSTWTTSIITWVAQRAKLIEWNIVRHYVSFGKTKLAPSRRMVPNREWSLNFIKKKTLN